MPGSSVAKTPPPRRLGSIPTAAEMAVCSTKTIRRLIAQGDLTGYRLGSRMIRVDLNELDEIMRPIPTSGDAA
jgi:excisionase family DNA binding protein